MTHYSVGRVGQVPDRNERIAPSTVGEGPLRGRDHRHETVAGCLTVFMNTASLAVARAGEFLMVFSLTWGIVASLLSNPQWRV